MTNLELEFDSKLIEALESVSIKLEALKKDIDVLWSSARITNDTLSSVNRVINNLNNRVNLLETKGAI
jgi:hypothetical protein